MSRYARTHTVRISGNAPSGRALRAALGDFSGHINWGYTKATDGFNSAESIRLASNKRKALRKMFADGVPTPEIFTPREAHHKVDDDTPLVGRTSYHTKNSGFWYCETVVDVERAIRSGATHFMPFVENAREFRVHVVNGYSIKISEKHKRYNPETGEFEEGSWTYPRKFKRKISLRRVAKQAMDSLELDFGAVDILYKKIGDVPTFFVLEVNCCPCLTDGSSDTLERYTRAFQEAQDEINNSSI